MFGIQDFPIKPGFAPIINDQNDPNHHNHLN